MEVAQVAQVVGMAVMRLKNGLLQTQARKVVLVLEKVEHQQPGNLELEVVHMAMVLMEQVALMGQTPLLTLVPVGLAVALLEVL